MQKIRLIGSKDLLKSGECLSIVLRWQIICNTVEKNQLSCFLCIETNDRPARTLNCSARIALPLGDGNVLPIGPEMNLFQLTERIAIVSTDRLFELRGKERLQTDGRSFDDALPSRIAIKKRKGRLSELMERKTFASSPRHGSSMTSKASISSSFVQREFIWKEREECRALATGKREVWFQRRRKRERENQFVCGKRSLMVAMVRMFGKFFVERRWSQFLIPDRVSSRGTNKFRHVTRATVGMAINNDNHFHIVTRGWIGE